MLIEKLFRKQIIEISFQNADVFISLMCLADVTYQVFKGLCQHDNTIKLSDTRALAPTFSTRREIKALEPIQ